MKIISWNVNGIRAVSKKGFFEFVEKESPDILCLQETKAHPEQLGDELINIPGYHSFWSAAEKKGYSGVATYTKTKPINVDHGFGVNKFDNEGRIVKTEFDKFVLFNIYFPNGQKDDERLQYKLDFYDEFLAQSEKEKKSGKAVISCGDYNTAHKEIDLKNPKANQKFSGFLPIEREWIDSYINKGYTDTFREFCTEADQYSWWSYRQGARSKNVGWRIDYFFINNEHKKHLKNAFILQEIEGSDHCPVGIETTKL